jgi:hypothetical protein
MELSTWDTTSHSASHEILRLSVLHILTIFALRYSGTINPIQQIYIVAIYKQ